MNRVRVYQNAATRGAIFVDFYEREEGDATRKPKRVRKPLHLDGRRIVDRAEAKAHADRVAAALRAREAARDEPLTLWTLFDKYLRTKTPTKARDKQQHDRRAAGLFLRCFGPDMLARNLSGSDWYKFVEERRSGALAPLPPVKLRTADEGTKRRKPRARASVGDRAVEYDLRWLLAVLNWATVAGDGTGRMLLDRNPLKGLPIPREQSPRRPVLDARQYEALRKAAGAVHPLFELAAVLAHETGHRIGAIRQLQWSDVDLTAATVRWRKQTDKCGYEHTTPLTDAAVEALRDAIAEPGRTESAWIFPAPGNPDEPCSRHLMRDWWERGAKLAKLPAGERYGWHALRRQFATDLKTMPLSDLCAAGGWKNARTVLVHYQQPDEHTMRQALANRVSFRRGQPA